MKRSVILVVSDDPGFVATAADVVIETRHVLRSAETLFEAGRVLTDMSTSDIGLAIIDLDLHDNGQSLLHIIGGCEPDFPIVSVGGDEALVLADESLASIAMEHLFKPVAEAELRSAVQELCCDEIMPRGRRFPGWPSECSRSPGKVHLPYRLPAAPPRIHLFM